MTLDRRLGQRENLLQFFDSLDFKLFDVEPNGVNAFPDFFDGVQVC